MITNWTPRYSLPDWLERAKALTLTLPVYRNGALGVPTAGVFSLYDSGGTAIVSAAAVSIVAGVATYSLSALALPASTYGIGDPLTEEWTLTLEGVSETFPRPAVVVRTRLWPVVTDQDLLGICADLRQILLDPTQNGTFQVQIDEAFTQVQTRLMASERWPFLVLDPWALRNVTLFLAMHLVWGSNPTPFGENYADREAKRFWALYVEEWSKLKFSYDTNADGRIQKQEIAAPSRPPLYIGQGGHRSAAVRSPGRW